MTFVRAFLGLILVCSPLSGCGETINPVIQIELHIGLGDIGELSQMLERFAESEGFTLEDLGQDMSPRIDSTRYVFIQLKRDETMRIIVENFFQERFLISFYNLRSDPRFEETAKKLQDLLQGRWPGDVRPPTGT
jgi:hypothetical protein